MRSLARFGPLALFLGLAALLWRPFDSDRSLYRTPGGNAVPAGEIVAGFQRTQHVTPPADARLPPRATPCVGILFATYVRSNDARLDVAWAQAGRQQAWRVDSRDLVDNAHRMFCPGERFDVDQPFDLRVEGVDGRPGRSPTLWLLPDTALGTAIGPPGTEEPPRSLGLNVVARKTLLPGTIAGLAHGAFLLGWLCTVVIGAMVLLYRAAPREKADPR